MKIRASLFNKYPIIAAYLFGSRAGGRIGLLSDYDFGIQLEEKTHPSEYLEIKLRIMADLARAVKSEAVDVVIINEAPLLLKYQILRWGKPIYERHKAQRALLTFKTLTQYLDWSYFDKLFSKALIEKTASEGLNV